MHLKTILNRVEPFKSFVYGKEYYDKQAPQTTIIVSLKPRKNSRPICSCCNQRGSTYDRQPERRFEYVPLWGHLVFFLYALRRVNCTRCGVKVERVPWCDGKHRLTTRYRWFLATWAKRLSWSEVAAIFHTSWDSVCRAVEHAVEWGLKHRDLAGITAVGIDEVAWRKGHTYLTLLYDISGATKRLLAIAEQRTEESLQECLRCLNETLRAKIQFVCSDMWRPYLAVIRQLLPNCVHVLDRFHIMQKFNKAIDEVRADEARRMQRDGFEPLLTKTRWLLLKRPENLTEGQEPKLRTLLQYNLQSVRAYLLREEFQRFWEYVSPAWAEKFLEQWTSRAMRSRLEPLKKVARMVRHHQTLILNWFRAKGEISSGGVEGLNNKVKLVCRKSYGFRTAKVAKLALYHNLGKLPEPEFTHRFC